MQSSFLQHQHQQQFQQSQTDDLVVTQGAAQSTTNSLLLHNEAQIAASNPSLIGGYRILYEREVPFELHVVDEEMTEKIGHSVKQNEVMLVKVLIRGHDENPAAVKIELLSKRDYFFLYEHVCDFFEYQEMKEAQELKPEYADYCTMLIKLFNQAITAPETLKCQMQTNKDDSGDLYFNHFLPYKRLQMLGCHFTLAPRSKIEKFIRYRYRAANLKLQQMQAKLSKVCSNVKLRNPSLIQHICTQVQLKRGVSGAGSSYKASNDLSSVRKKTNLSATRSTRSKTSGKATISRRSINDSLSSTKD